MSAFFGQSRVPLFWAALWVWFCYLLGADNFASIDLWGKLSIPAIIRDAGVFPYRDYFSYTAQGLPWVDHEWLSGVFFYIALWLGGDAGLSVLKAAALGLMLWGILRANETRAGSPLFAMGVALLGTPMLVTGFMATGRPQIFTFAGLALLLALLESARRSGRFRRLAWLLPFGVVWANLHAGFVAGLGILILYAAGEALRRKPFLPFLLAAGGMGLVSIVNPYGVDYWHYLAYAITLPRAEITEWRPVPLWDDSFLELKILALMVLGTGLCTLRHRGKAWDWTAGLVLSVLLYLAFGHIKHQPMLVIGAAALLPGLVSGAPWNIPSESRFATALARVQVLGRFVPWGLLAYGVVALVLLCQRVNPLLVQVRSEQAPASLTRRYAAYPVGAVRFLAQSPYRGNVLTPFSWGEFAYWELYPRFRVSMDGRLEAVYPMSVFQSQQRFMNSKAFHPHQPEMERADFLLLPVKFKHIPPLLSSGEWRSVYRDARYVVLARPKALAGVVGARGTTPTVQPGDRTAFLPMAAYFRPAVEARRFKDYRLESPVISPRRAEDLGHD